MQLQPAEPEPADEAARARCSRQLELVAAAARSGSNALRANTASMAAAAQAAMSPAEFFDHLAERGWLDYLAAPQVFESGDDWPASVLAGTEMEEARRELLANEVRYVVRHEHGDVLVQTEAKNFFGNWQSVGTAAASFSNDEVRLLPNAHSATGDALCLRARLEPRARDVADDADPKAEQPPQRGSGMFVWQETELVIERSSAASQCMCQVQRYMCGASCVADTARRYAFVERRISRPRAVPAPLPPPELACELPALCLQRNLS